MSDNFLSIGKKFSNLSSSKAVVLKIPYEMTTSFVSGCKDGPNSIINASAHVELYDEKYEVKPHIVGVSTQEVTGFTKNHDKNLRVIGNDFLKYYKKGKFVVGLGGEHSITIGIVNALSKVNKKFSIIQFDAHADLRSYYQKSHNSHACVMRRAMEKVPNAIQIGIRSIGEQEGSFIDRHKLNILWAYEMETMTSGEILERVFEAISNDDVYLTFDVDYFSLDIIRSTGTPEPGGPGWYKTLRVLEGIFKKYSVIGMDVVELIGNDEDATSAFSAALLVRKCLANKFFAKH